MLIIVDNVYICKRNNIVKFARIYYSVFLVYVNMFILLVISVLYIIFFPVRLLCITALYLL